MKQKKSILAVIFSLIFSIFFLSGQLFAYKESDLKKLYNTNVCRNCDLRGLRFHEGYNKERNSQLLKIKQNLSNSDLSGSNLKGIHLQQSDLTGANLSGTNLTRARLKSINLSGANLTRANLSGADLRGANLSGANLSGANLRGANLSGANVFKAKMKGMFTDTKTNMAGVVKTRPVKVSKKPKKQQKQPVKVSKKSDAYKILATFYTAYSTLKRCHEVRKGYAVVFVNSVEMAKIKSNAKKIETGIFKKFPELESQKDEIWKVGTKPITPIQVHILTSALKPYFGTIQVTSDLNYREVCRGLINQYELITNLFTGGSTAEKDF